MSNKKQKKEETSEAAQVLVDFLTSLLTRQQAFLREVANSLFQLVAMDISVESLENLFDIITTNDAEAQRNLVNDPEEPDADDEEGEIEEAEMASEDSDSDEADESDE